MKSNRKKRVWLRVLLGVLISIVVIIGGILAFVLIGKDATISQALKTVPLDSAADGVYEGSYSGFRWSNTLQVTVEDHMITDIKVMKQQAFITPETMDTLTDRVISEQTPDVDTVSGATVDSKAFLKAVENALESAKTE